MEKPIYPVEVLKDINELWALENEFLNAIGEEPLEKMRVSGWQKPS